jgi:hypothetical protein
MFDPKGHCSTVVIRPGEWRCGGMNGALSQSLGIVVDRISERDRTRELVRKCSEKGTFFRVKRHRGATTIVGQKNADAVAVQ